MWQHITTCYMNVNCTFMPITLYISHVVYCCIWDTKIILKKSFLNVFLLLEPSPSCDKAVWKLLHEALNYSHSCSLQSAFIYFKSRWKRQILIPMLKCTDQHNILNNNNKKETSRGALRDRYISIYLKYICIWYHNKP